MACRATRPRATLEDVFGCGGPDGGLGIVVVRGEVVLDLGDLVDDQRARLELPSLEQGVDPQVAVVGDAGGGVHSVTGTSSPAGFS